MLEASGKVVSGSTHIAYCEFIPKILEGSLLYYHEGDKKIFCRVTYLRTSPYKGTIGHASILDPVNKPPRYGTQLFLADERERPNGVYIPVGQDRWNREVSIRLNALFRNLFIGGKTQSGKTHLAIVLAEEFLKLRVPHVIIDTQNEFLGLAKLSPDVVVTLDFRTILSAVKHRKTVIVPLMGESILDKARKVEQIVSGLRSLKERSYKTNPLKYPPVIITIDEVEVFAPNNYTKVPSSTCRAALEDLVKRGVKFGLGTVLICQRPPMLDFEIRSQCNGAAIFLVDDHGSLTTIKLLGYVTRYETDMIRLLHQGECILTGAIVEKPIMVKVREIQCQRTKNVNFEELLDLPRNGVESSERARAVPDNARADHLVYSQGEVINTETGEVVAVEREAREGFRGYR